MAPQCLTLTPGNWAKMIPINVHLTKTEHRVTDTLQSLGAISLWFTSSFSSTQQASLSPKCCSEMAAVFLVLTPGSRDERIHWAMIQNPDDPLHWQHHPPCPGAESRFSLSRLVWVSGTEKWDFNLNEWMNEWMNEWTNEWMNQQTKEWMNE